MQIMKENRAYNGFGRATKYEDRLQAQKKWLKRVRKRESYVYSL